MATNLQKQIMLVGSLSALNAVAVRQPRGIGEGPAAGGWFRDAAGTAKYKVASGDTINTIAAKWLGSSSRSRELWNLQSWRNDSRHGGDINKIFIGDVMVMPADAIAKAVSLGMLAGDAGATVIPFPTTLPTTAPPLALPAGFQLPTVTPDGTITLPAGYSLPNLQIPTPTTLPQLPAATPTTTSAGPITLPETTVTAGAGGTPAKKDDFATLKIVGGVGLALAALVGGVAVYRHHRDSAAGGAGLYQVVQGRGRARQVIGQHRTFERAMAQARSIPGAMVQHPAGG